MSDVPESSSDNRDGSERESGQSDVASSNRSSDNDRLHEAGNNGPPPAAGQQGGVPQYVDMVIPQYESSSGENGRGRQHQNSSETSPLANAETSSDSNGDTGQDSAGTSQENDSAENDQQSEDSGEIPMGERISDPAEVDVLLNEGEEHPGNKKVRSWKWN